MATALNDIFSMQAHRALGALLGLLGEASLLQAMLGTLQNSNSTLVGQLESSLETRFASLGVRITSMASTRKIFQLMLMNASRSF